MRAVLPLAVKNHSLTLMLLGMVIAGPLVAYAGVSVIWPESTHTINVNTSPPITFVAGADYATAQAMNYIAPAAFDSHNNGASFTITVSGLSGGTVTIDDYVSTLHNAGVTSYRLTMASVTSDTLAPPPAILKLRLWTGTDPPDTDTENDADTTVCDVLNLLLAAPAESSGGAGPPDDPCTGVDVSMQILIQYATDTTGSKVLGLRPSSIVYP